MSVEKLPALTSIRFFAASLIVIHHSRGLFGIGRNINDYFPTYQAVSLFFVLSGFILTYVYKSFGTRRDIRKFYVARIARIWPLHFVTLMIAFLLFHYHDLPATLIANFFMVQAWIPIKAYFWSFNAVSWSISTEFAFYLLFPFLLFNFKKNWKAKLAFTFFLSISIVIVSTVMMLPNGDDQGIGILGVVNINPMVRLFEFTVGMCGALFYDRLKNGYHPSLTKATMFESIISCAVIGGMALNRPIQSMVEPVLGKAATAYIDNGVLHSFAFAIMLLLFSQEKGKISRLLSKKVFVLLGEISFSVYLLHHILLRLYKSWIAPVDTLPGFFSYVYFWGILITGSYMMWYAIEKPSRKAIISIGRSFNSNTRKERYSDRFSCVNLLFCFIIMLALIFPLAFFVESAPAVHCIAQSEVKVYLDKSDEKYRDVRFGEKLVLVGAGFDNADDGSGILHLVWKAEEDVELSRKVAVHFVDISGKILGQADYSQSRPKLFSSRVAGGMNWLDTIKIPKHFWENAQSVGICIYSDRSILGIDKGPRDWSGKRLLIGIQRTS